MTKAKTPEEKAAAKDAKAKVQPEVKTEVKTTARKAKNIETKFISSAGKNGRVKSFSM